MKKRYYTLLLIALPLYADMLISPLEVMSSTFKTKTVAQDSIILTPTQAKAIETNAKAEIGSKIVKVFKANSGGKTVGYGVLLNRKVRSKTSVILYTISPTAELKGAEVVAFNEPPEYMTSTKWLSQLDNIPAAKIDESTKKIPTITGATMSARNALDGARVAMAIYNEVLAK